MRGATMVRAEATLPTYTAYAQVLVTDTDHTTPSVLIVTDKSRYLFNCCDGQQRLIREYKIRLPKIDHYFFTRISTDTLAGFPGMLLSRDVPDSGGLLESKYQCTAFGPAGLSDYCSAFSQYLNKRLHYSIREFADSAEGPLPPVVESNIMTVTPVLLRPQVEQHLPEWGEEEEEEEQAAKRQRTEKAQANGSAASAGAARGGTPLGVDARVAVCYVCRLRDTPGKFDPQRATQLGVPRGKLWGQLKAGVSVKSVTGRVVQPEEVVQGSNLAPLLLIADCPSPAHLAALAASAELAELRADEVPVEGGGAAPRLHVAYHMGPAAVVCSEAYGRWMDSLGSAWRHVVINTRSHKPVALRSVAMFQAKLHVISPALFPLGRISAQPLDPHAPVQSRALPPCTAAAGASTPPVGPAPPSEAQHPTVNGKDPSTDAAAAALAAGTEPSVAAAAAAPADTAALSVGATGPAASSTAATALAPGTGSSGANGCGSGATAAPAAGGAESAIPRLVVGVMALKHVLMPPARQRVDRADVAGPLDLQAPVTDITTSLAARGLPAGVGAPDPGGAEEEGVPEALRGIGREECEVVLLGTISSVPSKYRNVSAAYVDLFHKGGILVDCGEDTLGQLQRRYGSEGAAARVAGLRVVWVSHMHADHHGGLYPLLEARRRAGAPPLLILGPPQLERVLASYSRQLPLSFHFLPNTWFKRNAAAAGGGGEPSASEAALSAAVSALGLSGLSAFPVAHVAQSSGLTLTGASGWKIVFSGDTRPCDEVAEAARGAVLLVHEATFEDGMLDEAIARRHSTMSEALHVARKAGVYRLLLTHFSARYPKLPKLEEGGASNGVNVAIGFDLMSVNLADLAWMPRVTASLAVLMEAEEAAGEVDLDATGAD